MRDKYDGNVLPLLRGKIRIIQLYLCLVKYPQSKRLSSLLTVDYRCYY